MPICLLQTTSLCSFINNVSYTFTVYCSEQWSWRNSCHGDPAAKLHHPCSVKYQIDFCGIASRNNAGGFNVRHKHFMWERAMTERREVDRTPNIWRRSGSRKRKGMFETWRRFGVTFPSAESSAPDTPEPLPDAH